MSAPPTTTPTTAESTAARPPPPPGREAGPQRPADDRCGGSQGPGSSVRGAHAHPRRSEPPTETRGVGAGFLFSPDGRLSCCSCPVSWPTPHLSPRLGATVASGASRPPERRGKPTTGQLCFRKRNETPRTVLHPWCSLQFH